MPSLPGPPSWNSAAGPTSRDAPGGRRRPYVTGFRYRPRVPRSEHPDRAAPHAGGVCARLRNGVLTHVAGTGPASCEPDVEVTLDEDGLRALLLGETPLADLVEQGRAKADGDLAKVDELLGHLAEPDPGFAIVTP
ncbi:alkyl sulfatase C-terminal domain-containing protein [Streptomyces sp. NPDC102437]|uniref:alkyl sulfatase C-terminal domain-containing protein n=1 Tax=Streptomyces sp. NPDC102437 TaxID=3366175 RepID=UPI0037FEC87D